MELNRIHQKYCKDNKVQLMLSNAIRQIILSDDGYLYLRTGDTTVHKYLSDPLKSEMPYYDNPSSETHATHLFKYAKIYPKFTRCRYMNNAAPSLFYSFTFLYFLKDTNGDAICAEFDFKDFEICKEYNLICTRNSLEEYLYSTNNISAKCIFEWHKGIMYAAHSKESLCIKEPFISLEDADIISKYNIIHQPILPLFNEDRRKQVESDKSWMAHKIEDTYDVVLTEHGIFSSYRPMLLVIKDDEIYVDEFSIKFRGKDWFDVNIKRRCININPSDILSKKDDSEYTEEPDFA